MLIHWEKNKRKHVHCISKDHLPVCRFSWGCFQCGLWMSFIWKVGLFRLSPIFKSSQRNDDADGGLFRGSYLKINMSLYAHVLYDTFQKRWMQFKSIDVHICFRVSVTKPNKGVPGNVYYRVLQSHWRRAQWKRDGRSSDLLYVVRA